jgi:uncharacterized protein (TIGR00255 family)
MLKSMTAFSQASETCDQITADITMRSYNSRYLDMAYYSPESCQVFEEDIKKMIAKTVCRGRVEVRLSLSDETVNQDLFEVDNAVAASYFRALTKIKADLNLPNPIGMSDVLTGRNLIVPSRTQQDAKKIWAAVALAVEAATGQLDQMRQKEGKNLYTDLMERMVYIENNLKHIETEAAAIPQIYKQRLMDRISRLCSDTDVIDPLRISQEAAMLADKSDVSEEIVRLYSHIKLFKDTLDADQSQGRKLNFMVQEFNREFNTIGSKAGQASLSHRVVDMKSELEKIREQVQNVE